MSDNRFLLGTGKDSEVPEHSGFIDPVKQAQTITTPVPNPPLELLAREVAETLVLLDYVSSRPEGLNWPAPVPQLPTPSQIVSGKHFRVQEIERDLQNLTSVVTRIYMIRGAIEEKYHNPENWPSDAAFLLQVKSILSEIAAPATSRTIAFTSMVSGDADFFSQKSDGNKRLFGGPIAEIAFPELMRETDDFLYH